MIKSIYNYKFRIYKYSKETIYSRFLLISEKIIGFLLTAYLANKLSYSDIKGYKICRQADANWVEDFDKRTDPTGRTYYWLTGSFQNFDKGDDTDEWALANGFVSVVPVQYDVTSYDFISELKSWGL